MKNLFILSFVLLASLGADAAKVDVKSPDGKLVEAVEIPANDFFIGVQFHPEFKSRPNAAHPLFREFIAAAVRFSKKKKNV